MPDRPLPYGLPTDPAKRHSAALTDGPDRAAAAPTEAGRLTDEFDSPVSLARWDSFEPAQGWPDHLRCRQGPA